MKCWVGGRGERKKQNTITKIKSHAHKITIYICKNAQFIISWLENLVKQTQKQVVSANSLLERTIPQRKQKWHERDDSLQPGVAVLAPGFMVSCKKTQLVSLVSFTYAWPCETFLNSAFEELIGGWYGERIYFSHLVSPLVKRILQGNNYFTLSWGRKVAPCEVRPHDSWCGT